MRDKAGTTSGIMCLSLIPYRGKGDMTCDSCHPHPRSARSPLRGNGCYAYLRCGTYTYGVTFDLSLNIDFKENIVCYF